VAWLTRAAAALEYSIPPGHRLAQYGLHCLIIIRVGFSPRRPFVGARRSLGRNRTVKGLLQPRAGRGRREISCGGEISRVFDLDRASPPSRWPGVGEVIRD